MKKNDGRPAFPIYQEQMNLGDTAGPGMSLRDWFAGHAGQEALALLARYYGDDWMESGLVDAFDKLAETKMAIADAMIAERDKEA